MAADAEVGEDFERAITPVADWAARVTGLPVVHDRAEVDGDAAVVLQPLDLVLPAVPTGVLPRTRLAEVSLRLLVSVNGPTARAAAAATCALALDATVEAEWPVEPGPPDLALWQALGQPPAPAFVLVVPVRRVVPLAPTPLVRQPLQVVGARMRTVTGRVVAPSGEPVAGARVGLADGNGATLTDHRGRFRLEVAAATGDALPLVVVARGFSVDLRTEPPADAGGALGDLVIPLPEPAPTSR